MGVMGKWHRVQTAEASAVHNDVSAFSTDEVRDGPWIGVLEQGKLESGIYCSIRVHMPYQYTSASEYGIW